MRVWTTSTDTGGAFASTSLSANELSAALACPKNPSITTPSAARMLLAATATACPLSVAARRRLARRVKLALPVGVEGLVRVLEQRIGEVCSAVLRHDRAPAETDAE